MAEIALSHETLLAEIAATETSEGNAAFWWMGQHTFIVKAGGKVIYIDPWFANWSSRQTPALLTPQEAKLADFALITHGHGDHLCPETLPHMAQASPKCLFVSPKTEKARMLNEGKVPAARLMALDAGGAISVGGIKITAIKAKHESFDKHPTEGFPYLGYVVEIGGVRFYHAGDTIGYEGLLTTLQKWPSLDVAFLPINGRDAVRYKSGCMGNMTFQEAAELAGELGVGLAVPAHYDMFIGNQENPQKFVDFLQAKYPQVKYWVGKAGQRVRFGKKPETEKSEE